MIVWDSSIVWFIVRSDRAVEGNAAPWQRALQYSDDAELHLCRTRPQRAQVIATWLGRLPAEPCAVRPSSDLWHRGTRHVKGRQSRWSRGPGHAGSTCRQPESRRPPRAFELEAPAYSFEKGAAAFQTSDYNVLTQILFRAFRDFGQSSVERFPDTSNPPQHQTSLVDTFGLQRRRVGRHQYEIEFVQDGE